MFRKNRKLNIWISYTDNGIVIVPNYIIGRDSYDVVFPLYKNSYILKDIISDEDYNKLLILEDLWLDDILREEKDKYIILFDDLYLIDIEALEMLNIQYKNDIDIELISNKFIGHEDFHINYSLISQIYGKLDGFYKRYGNIILFDEHAFLLDIRQYKLIEELDNYQRTCDPNTQGLFVAKVKSKGEKAGAKFDEYLKNEECYFPEDLDLDIVKHSDAHLELMPSFKDIDKDLNRELIEGKRISSINSFSSNERRRRVFLDNKVVNDLNYINSNRQIKDEQVPRFLNNPYAFLPELNIDLDEFGARVKGLKIRTYKAQPFFECRDDGKSGWFDFDMGVYLKKKEIFLDDDKCTEDLLDSTEFNKILQKAKELGNQYVQYKGKWIEVDVIECEKFVEAEQQMKNHFGDNRFNIKHLSYVLEIYDNISDLEYNATFLKLKDELYGSDNFFYIKPKHLKADLYDYQKEGFLWFKLLKDQNLGGLLADDMGLGKTIQVIAFIAFLKEIDQLKPSLLVMPSALIDNWIREIKKFTYGINDIYVHWGPQRIKDSHYISMRDITITTYETLVRDQIILGKLDWNLFVIDEAQRIKNITTLSTSAVKAMKCKYPIALTGTPVENNLSELWSIMDFVQPGLLGSYKSFRHIFQIPIEENINDDFFISRKKDELINKIEPVFLRRTKEDKLENLPDKSESFINCNMGSVQEKLYSELIRDIKENPSGGRVLTGIHKLMQICSHVRLVRGDIQVSSSTLMSECNKLTETVNILENIRALNEKVVIFTKYKKMQYILRTVIYDKFGIWSNIINGDVNRNRLDLIRDFEDRDGFNVIILSPRAAGVGLNIIGANHVIHYTREWNPAVENQATDRVYRIGQQKDVKVYYPICVSSKGITVEQKLNDLLQNKKKLANEIVIPIEKLNITEKDFIEVIN